MVNPELIKQLLRELEEERGLPIQIRIEIPGNLNGHESELVVYGSFESRRLTVKREIIFDSYGLTAKEVEDLSRQYAEIADLLEGSYESLSRLREKMKEHDLYRNNIVLASDGIFKRVLEHVAAGMFEMKENTKIADINLELLAEE